jgi:hypothetical protein
MAIVNRAVGEISTLKYCGPTSKSETNRPLSAIGVRHDACGEIADPLLTCVRCGEKITAPNVSPEPGPGFRAKVLPKRA